MKFKKLEWYVDKQSYYHADPMWEYYYIYGKGCGNSLPGYMINLCGILHKYYTIHYSEDEIYLGSAKTLEEAKEIAQLHWENTIKLVIINT